MTTRPDGVRVEVVHGVEARKCAELVARHHYLTSAPDPRTRPMCHVIRLGGTGAFALLRVGCLWWGRPEATRCYRGTMTYGSCADVKAGRARFDRWEVLALSRVWLDPLVQPGGALYDRAHLPGFVDRNRRWRSLLATTALRLSLARVGLDYLLTHPPVYVEQPYAIRAALSYCDTRLHRGTIYRAGGWLLARPEAAPIQTWWTPCVAPLSEEEHAQVREAAENCPRSWRVRNRHRNLFTDSKEEQEQS